MVRKNIPDFWKEIWAQSKIIHSKQYDNIIDDMQKMPGAKWFSGARLNFAENLLRFRNDQYSNICNRRKYTLENINL